MEELDAVNTARRVSKELLEDVKEKEYFDTLNETQKRQYLLNKYKEVHQEVRGGRIMVIMFVIIIIAFIIKHLM